MSQTTDDARVLRALGRMDYWVRILLGLDLWGTEQDFTREQVIRELRVATEDVDAARDAGLPSILQRAHDMVQAREEFSGKLIERLRHEQGVHRIVVDEIRSAPLEMRSVVTSRSVPPGVVPEGLRCKVAEIGMSFGRPEWDYPADVHFMDRQP